MSVCLCISLFVCERVCGNIVLHSVPIWLSPTKQSWIYCRPRQSRAVLSVICKAGEKQLQRSLSKPSSCQSKSQHYFPPTIKHYFPPTIKGLHHFARPGQVGKQAEVEEARKQAIHCLPPILFLISNQKVLLCIVSDALAPNSEMNKGRSERMQGVDKASSWIRCFIKSWFRRETATLASLPTA